ncbi:MAG: dihydroorotase [Ruminococcaceae bacterium]|nr:dihydroorotase [Oscillospiraceae bacterium]
MKITFSNPSVFLQDPIIKKENTFVAETSLLGDVSVDSSKYVIFPGFVDVHVHFRQPGFSYKETIASGSAAAARGGYTAVCTMPNLDPVPDSRAGLQKQLDIIERDAKIKVIPFGSITKGEKGEALSDIEDIASDVCGFSDDGRGVDSSALMKEAMLRAKALDKVISAHCEDGTQIKDSPEAEYKQIERDIALAEETGVKYHVCHISTAESVELIRNAKARGVDVTCETAPHYLVFSENDVIDDGRFRMNPPIRTERDRLALIDGIKDGTIDMIATDHAPHSAEEKSKGLKSLNGIVGLECAFAVLYTELVKKNLISLKRLIELMSINPAKRFGIDPEGYCVFDLENEYVIDVDEFASMGKCTPFENKKVYGRCIATVSRGKLAYLDPKINKA